jgi:hypothetical protein
VSQTVEQTIADFVALAQADLTEFDNPKLSDLQLAQVMTAAVRLYAARCDAMASFPPPLLREKVTATDVLVSVCEMIRVADVNLFDLSMWHGRPRPKE